MTDPCALARCMVQTARKAKVQEAPVEREVKSRRKWKHLQAVFQIRKGTEGRSASFILPSKLKRTPSSSLWEYHVERMVIILSSMVRSQVHFNLKRTVRADIAI